MIVGMDFGTTNSGMAVYDGRQVDLLPIDPSNANPAVARTALYVTNDQSLAIGRAAVNRYFEQNLGRPIRLERVWVGEIEMVFAELPAFIRDVYAWVDTLSPGRLFLSFKTALREAQYPGTVVGQFFLPLEDLIASYLYATKRRAEKTLGRELGQIVLGRPVRFSTDPQADRVAQERLIEAAFRAGYETVYLEYEPIAAAFHYADQAQADQRILVFDFGGGTLDITIMEIGRTRRTVLATGGLPIAGDVFDQKLLRGKMTTHFGEGTEYGPKDAPLPVPTWIYDTLADWQALIELQMPERLRMLREMASTSRQPRKLQHLIDLVTGNYGLRLFEVVEAAKRRLSELPQTDIRLATPQFNIRQPVTRHDFETIIQPEIYAIDALLDETVQRSGLRPRDMDVVIRTGGSSQIPVFQEMLARKFGAEKVRSIDIFSSVTSGLSIIGHGIEKGDIGATAYRKGQAHHADLSYERPNVAPVNLDLLKRRLDLQEADHSDEPARPALVFYGGHRLLTAPQAPHGDKPVSLADLSPDPDFQPQTALALTPDEPLLLVTSKYRLVLTSQRQLASLQEGGFARADLRDFEPGEEICVVARWNDIRETQRLVLVTSKGLARGLSLERARPTIEGPRPTRLDWPMPNWPAAVLGANPDDALVAATDSGRLARVAVSSLSVQGTTLVKLSKTKGERLVGVLPTRTRDQIVVLTADGYAKRLPAHALTLAAEPTPGQAVTRREIVGVALARPKTELWAVTTTRLLPVRPESIPLELDPTVKSHKLLKLDAGERVLALLAVPPAQAAAAQPAEPQPALRAAR
ncbi:MAG: Hsp70 family protein [Anaerolineae bacterium]|nr:Hsp70 family protein [Anaerolineae bacterium]